MTKNFITTILLLATLLIGVFYLFPGWNNFRTLRDETKNLQDTSNELDNIIDKRNTLAATISSVSKEDLARIDQTVPTGPQATTLLVMLDQAASKYSLRLKQTEIETVQSKVKVGAPLGGQPTPRGPTVITQKNAYNEFSFSITLVGSYESFKSFLGDVEKRLRIIDIQGITFHPSEKINAVEFSVRAKAYYQ